MKPLIHTLAFVQMIQICSCQQVLEKTYEFHVEVVDESGDPVPDAMVQASRDELIPGSPIPTSRPVRVNVPTDQKGAATIRFNSVHVPSGVAITKDGYYSTTATAAWIHPENQENGSAKTQIKAILKPVKNPIPMHAYSNAGGMEKIVKIPGIGGEYGFDLMLAEALPPLGNGKTADFTFSLEGAHEKTGSYDMRLKITFPSPHDGAVEFMTPRRTGMREPHIPGSRLLSRHLAPENGYVPEIIRTAKRSSLTEPADKNDDIHRNFYFRTRTKVDASGRIISANYGKIYGDFHFAGANSQWGYIATLALVITYFNPTPNDRNVEFDPKRNLNPDGNVQQP